MVALVTLSFPALFFSNIVVLQVVFCCGLSHHYLRQQRVHSCPSESAIFLPVQAPAVRVSVRLSYTPLGPFVVCPLSVFWTHCCCWDGDATGAQTSPSLHSLSLFPIMHLSCCSHACNRLIYILHLFSFFFLFPVLLDHLSSPPPSSGVERINLQLNVNVTSRGNQIFPTFQTEVWYIHHGVCVVNYELICINPDNWMFVLNKHIVNNIPNKL